MVNKDLNRIKVVLADKKRTNKWQKILPPFLNGVQTVHSQT